MINPLARCLRHPLRSAFVFLSLFLVMADGIGVAQAAVYPLEIIAPRAGLTTANRYYKAYPGFVYDVNVGAIGGRFPYTFSLTTAPSGMTIDAGTGRISWPSPAANATAYPVTVSVRDSAGASVNVSWTVLVTTSGFKFIDGVNGRTVAQGGDGSATNPWRSPADWYGAKNDSPHRGVFLYWRNGNYRISDAPIEDGIRMALAGSNKPLVWLAYPGEAPVIDTTNSHICIYSGSSNVYFDGLTIQNFTTNFGIRIDSSGDNAVFRNNTFRNMQAGWGGSGTNASALMIANGGTLGHYWYIVNNSFSGIHDVGYGILSYLTQRTLVERNRFTDITVSEAKAIGPKAGNSMWFIRDNRINIQSGLGIWVDTYNSAGENTRDIEISYNLVQVANGRAMWIGQEAVTYGPMTSLRNTFVGAGVEISNLTSSSGPASFDRDVIQNSTTATNRIITSGTVQTNNLLTGASGLVDANGNLSTSYIQYLGTHGYQRDGSADKFPMPPSNVSAL